MDGENNGKTLLKWMIWGEKPIILGNPLLVPYFFGGPC